MSYLLHSNKKKNFLKILDPISQGYEKSNSKILFYLILIITSKECIFIDAGNYNSLKETLTEFFFQCIDYYYSCFSTFFCYEVLKVSMKP